MESLIFLNFLTIFICTGIILFFRRMDRANTRIVKLKRFTDNSLKEFQKLVAAENRKFNDATIEMDLLLKKAGSLSTTVRGAVSELENRMSSLDTEKAGLRKIEEDLSSVSDAAVNVNEQLRYIEHARSDFGTVVKKINALNDGMKQLEKNNAALYHNFNEKLRDRSRELS
ncbi:MAG: SpiroCoCo family coiled-coil protein, partial [Spirochaetota bacterium]